jgi:hypothetical protein
VIASPSFSRGLLQAVNYIYQPTVFIRRSALDHEETFVREDLRFVMDRDLWLRLSMRCRFRRLPRPLAIDRHQRYRKVASSEFLTEAKRFNESVGIKGSAKSRATAALTGVYMRAAGAKTMALLPRQVEPAIRLRIPPLIERMWRQAAVRRSQFGYAADVK